MIPIEQQRRKLGEWLAEWELACRLDEESSVDLAGVASYPAADAFPPIFEVGDVVLFRPVVVETARRPVYGVLLARDVAGHRWQMALFGRFAVPALPDECATTLEWPLAVVCCRLTRWVPDRWLEAVWPAGEVSADVLASIRAPRPEMCGPPLIHPLDPRHRYVAEDPDVWGAVAAWMQPENLSQAAESP